jgi:predicted phage tail protein
VQSVFTALPVDLRFTVVEGAASYRVMLATDPDFKAVVREALINPSQVVSFDGLEEGAYFLAARSIDDLGLEGSPSAAVDINVRLEPLPPMVQFPESGGRYWGQRNVTLQWTEVARAAKYQIQIASDSDFQTVVEDVADIEGNVHTTAALEPGRYHLRLRSIAHDGHAGAWSPLRPFAVTAPIPPAPIEIPHLDKEGIHVRWRDLGEAVTYHLQMAGDREFRELLADTRVDAPQATLRRPAKHGRYYVRVAAIDRQGLEGEYAPARSVGANRIPYIPLATVTACALLLALIGL